MTTITTTITTAATTTFRYRAIDTAGAVRRGAILAQDERDAYRRLSVAGLTPTRLCMQRGGRARGGKARVSSVEIAHFTYQLAVLLQARIPISDGLLSIAEQEPNARFRRLLEEVAGAIQAGSTITDALEPHRRTFGDVYLETVHAAEKSGAMISVFESLADMLERQAESRRQLKGAVTYPIVVLVALSAAVTFLLTFVVPKFASMFAQRGVDLPLLTRMLQAFGLSIRSFWWAYAGGAGFTVLGLRAMWGSTQGRAFLDRLLHKAPVVRPALVGLATGRFARVLGLCLGAGLGLLESLEMAGRATGRPLLIRDVRRMTARVRAGGKLSDAMRDCAYLPSFARRMMASGEESGELTRLCGVVSRHYDREVAHLTKNIATILEPVLIAVMTGVVLVVALAIFLPMWDMAGLIG